MARVSQLVCDRCKKSIGENISGNSAGQRLMRYNTDYHGTQVDLCSECAATFFAWLEDQSGAPPGYKYQIRPCPHLVPCANPDGCSGKELVPIGAG